MSGVWKTYGEVDGEAGHLAPEGPLGDDGLAGVRKLCAVDSLAAAAAGRRDAAVQARASRARRRSSRGVQGKSSDASTASSRSGHGIVSPGP
jgi:hypothetical protein